MTETTCPLPPEGWWCSREAGHGGPCAARRVRLSKPSWPLRLYAFLTFPWAVEGSAVWWWRMHSNSHGDNAIFVTVSDPFPTDPECPYCPND